jgi:RimJ/RimL family protein N-acetyltransferase
MIRTQRLLLRGWREEDLVPLARINADPVVGRFLRGRPETWEETVDQIERTRRHWEQWGYGRWAVEHVLDGAFLGFIGFSHHRWYPDEIEIGWRLDCAYWGRGLATEGAAAALRHGFTEPGFSRVISVIHRDNTASRRVAEKIGLRLWRETEHSRPETGEPLPIVVYATEPAIA